MNNINYFEWRKGEKLTKDEREALEIINHLRINTPEINEEILNDALIQVLFNNTSLSEFVEQNKGYTREEREKKAIMRCI